MAQAELHRFEQGVMEERNQRDKEVRDFDIIISISYLFGKNIICGYNYDTYNMLNFYLGSREEGACAAACGDEPTAAATRAHAEAAAGFRPGR